MSTQYVNSMRLVLGLLSVIALPGCEDLIVPDTQSLLVPGFHRSEIVGIVWPQ